MIQIKFNDTDAMLECGFARVTDNVVTLTGYIPQNTSGFLTYRATTKYGEEGKELPPQQLGDFSDYVTIYRVLDDGVQFSNDGSIYVPPAPPSLEEVKARKKQELTTARQKEEVYPVTTSKGTFTFDETSQNLLRNAKESLADEATRNWTTNDGVVVTMNKADFQDIFNASIARSDANFAKLKELKQQVNNATTVEEVEAIKWE